MPRPRNREVLSLGELEPPDYADKYLGRVCRLICQLAGVANNGAVVPLPEGTYVMVVRGEYLERPTDDDDYYRFTVAMVNKRGKFNKRRISCDGVANSMLEVCPGVVSWSPVESAAALAQGWDIFYCDGSASGIWQLCKLDEEERFKNDEDAWEFVWRRAVELYDTLALRALAFLYHRHPKEYKRIAAHCRKAGE